MTGMVRASLSPYRSPSGDMMKPTNARLKQLSQLSKIRDTIIAVLLVAAAVAIVAIYQIEASNTEPVSITKNTGGAASQMVSQGGATGDEEGATVPDTPLDKWLAGRHSDTYVVAADGTNSTCNQCHDPINYVPSMEDMPASCTVCKFEIKPPPPLIEPANAHSVDCKVCHQVDRSGTVQADVSWLEVAAIEQYAKVSSTSQLCQNCHSGAEVEAPCRYCGQRGARQRRPDLHRLPRLARIDGILRRVRLP